MGFRFLPNSVTLNDLERLRNFTEFVALWADCVKVVVDIRILSAAEM